MRLVDLFAGLGGTSEGARMAGLSVLRAANHWGSAVEYHALNHPAVAHDLQDLQQANFYEYPDFDILAASPACQGHSHAKGKERFHHDAARSTAWAVVACAEAKRPPYLVVENVAAFTRWRLYPQWRSCLESLGYRLTENLLDAADCGVPQNRVRLFLVGALGGEVKVRPGTKPHVPARQLIDWTAGNWSRVNRPGRAASTLVRVTAGRRQYGRTFLVCYYGSGSGKTGRSLDRPLGTVTTRDRYALVDGDHMRMLTKSEYRRAMGFPEHYRLPPQHKLAVHLLGNAVPPPLAAHVLGQVADFHQASALAA